MSEQARLKQIKSPCVSICKYNKNNFCVGCKRHMNEIFDWFDYSDEMRTAITVSYTHLTLPTIYSV